MLGIILPNRPHYAHDHKQDRVIEKRGHKDHGIVTVIVVAEAGDEGRQEKGQKDKPYKQKDGFQKIDPDPGDKDSGHSIHCAEEKERQGCGIPSPDFFTDYPKEKQNQYHQNSGDSCLPERV